MCSDPSLKDLATVYIGVERLFARQFSCYSAYNLFTLIVSVKVYFNFLIYLMV